MRGSRRMIPILLVVILITMSIGAPLTSGQVMGHDYCAPGDQDHGPPDPPGENGASRPHIDLAPGPIELRFPGTSASVIQRGDYLVSRTAGPGEFHVPVHNLGNQDSPATSILFTLERPTGSPVTKTVSVGPIPAGTSITTVVQMTLGNGEHRLQVYANPDKDPEEACQDNRPNQACGNITQGCSYTYYDNNKRSIGIITGALPELRVQDITATTPTRATIGPSEESRTQIELTLANNGKTDAFALHETQETFTARVSVPGCGCAPKDIDVPRIPAGGTRQVELSMDTYGVGTRFTIQVQLDPYGETADLDRSHAHGEHSFEIPTADLVASIQSDHRKEGPRLLVPQGKDLRFDVTIENKGDVSAKTTDGGPFRVIVERDRSGRIIAETELTLAPGESHTLNVSDRWQNLDTTNVYRVTVDPDIQVMEQSRSGNVRHVPTTTARYDMEIRLEDDPESVQVPPNVDASIPFTLHNQGTVSDTYRLEVPAKDQDVQHYADMNGQQVDELTLAAQEETRLQLVRRTPKDGDEGTTYNTSIIVRSTSTDSTTEHQLDLVLGADTVPPKVRVEHPTHGFLTPDETIVLEVTDNVEVKKVETDLLGSYQVIQPDQPGGNLYTLNASGTPNHFRLNVRATDTAGNQDTITFTFQRDNNRPTIDRIQFTPHQGVRPGDQVTMLVDVYDDNLDRIIVQITQPRPRGETYQENITFRADGSRYILRDWTVPERPGHYVFTIKAIDKAGNEATRSAKLFVRGLSIEIVSVQPNVLPREPAEGEPVRFNYHIRNTSPHFETGSFFVTFNVDYRRQIGLERINLGPGENRAVSFTWPAEAGPHVFTFVADQAEEIAQDHDDQNKNLHFTTTEILFPDQDLFAPEILILRNADSFGELFVKHWWITLLAALMLGMFAATFLLARRKDHA
jgi:hypothetical protein